MLAPSSASPRLDIQLFGRFVVRIDDVAVDDRRWSRRAAQALVKLLALSAPHTLHREQLIDLLWPGQTPEAGVNSLNKALHAARRALEPDLARGAASRFILTPGNQVVLASPGSLRVDMHRFESAAHLAIRAQDPHAARAALALYAGALLIDDLYEPWAQSRRGLMQQLYRSTAITAARLFAQRRDPEPGIEIARRLVLDDPADEAAHLVLLQLHLAAGQRGLALDQYELACTALAAADLQPGPDMQALARELLQLPAASGRGGVVADALETSASGTGGTWSPHVEPITFRSGIVKTARLCPDGQSVLVCANWQDDRFDLHRLNLTTGESEPLPWHDVALMAVSPAGDLVLGLRPTVRNIAIDLCTLAIVPAAGGPAQELLAGVQYADWQPGATLPMEDPLQALAIVRDVDGMSRLEFPAGTVRLASAGWISHPRFSADGRHLACIEHPIDNDDEGDVVVIDLAEGGASRVLARGFLGVQGLAWRDGQVWFTAARKGQARSLRRVALSGEEQLMSQDLGNLKLHDAASNGRLLVAAERTTVGTVARHANDAAERDISWHDHTTPRDISADGRLLLVDEGYTAGRHNFGAYLRTLDGRRTHAIADGVPLVLSPDGSTVILRQPAARTRLTVLDVATRALRHLPNDDAQPVVHSEFVSFFPDGRRIVYAANQLASGLRIYVQDIDDGLPMCLRPDDAGLRMPWNRAVSPDGTRIVLLDAVDWLCVVPARPGAGTVQRLPLRGAEVRLVAWHEEAQSIFVCDQEGVPAQVQRCDLNTGERQPWMALAPADAGRVRAIRRLRMTADGRSYAYAYARESSDLYLFEDD
ncbi:MAG: PD40 domain-containing protein [Burkholderiaceae bacterium]|nr:PD40 domain-containing protein [Burkholderiaceae bacterium]